MQTPIKLIVCTNKVSLIIQILGSLVCKTKVQAIRSKAASSYFCFYISFIFIFLLLLSLNYLSNKKTREVIVLVEVRIDFKLNSSKVNETDLELKIEVFATIRFCFINAFFLQFFFYQFFRTSSINRQNSSFSVKSISS